MKNVNYLELNGTISIKGEGEFNYEEFFTKLNEIGYEFGGNYIPYSFKEVQKTITDIVESLTEPRLKRMIEIHNKHYGITDSSMIEEFLTTNFGTGIYQKVFLDSLDDEMIPKFNLYSNSNWQISDVFEGDLGEAVVVKMKELKLI